MRRETFTKLASGVFLYTLAVIAWGAFVRISGSGAGCGSHWPLCNGTVVPRSPSLETMIEYSHRLTSGLAFLAAVVLFYFSRKVFSKNELARKATSWAMFFMVVEALVGAVLVLLQLVGENSSSARALVIGLHLINSLLLSGALALTCWWSWRPEVRIGVRSIKKLWLYAFCAISILVVGATGAITALGDTLFPVSSLTEGFLQDLDPTSHVLLRLRVYHPVLAVLTSFVLMGIAATITLSEQHLRKKNVAVLLGSLVLLQITVGFANLLLLAPLVLQLAHLLIANFLWASFLLVAASEFELPPAYSERENDDSAMQSIAEMKRVNV